MFLSPKQAGVGGAPSPSSFFLMHRVGYTVQEGKKDGQFLKISKIAHNIFVIKAIDLKTTFLKSP